MPRYIFLDLETTGLEAGIDQITEAAWITDDGMERQYFVEHNRFPSDWVAKHTDYGTRILPADKVPARVMMDELRYDCGVLSGAGAEDVHIVGACPAFDDRFLRVAFGAQGVPYHYHVIDIEAMCFGALGLDSMPPLKVLREKLGLPGANEAAHTALADAREVKLIFDALRERTKAPA